MNVLYINRYFICFIIIFILFSVLSSSSLNADIYKYIDEQGVLHFTNTPTSSKYTIFIKEKREGYRQIGKKSALLMKSSPDSFDSIIKLASEKHDVSFPLIKAVIKAESNFNPRAESKVGAKGLMQLMDENLKYYHITNPFDPHENIMGGTCYLKNMLNRFNGRLDLALAAYNAGPEAVDRYKSIPPYKETVNYVKKVLRFHDDFSEKYDHIKIK